MTMQLVVSEYFVNFLKLENQEIAFKQVFTAFDYYFVNPPMAATTAYTYTAYSNGGLKMKTVTF